jgi:hypothetical protein
LWTEVTMHLLMSMNHYQPVNDLFRNLEDILRQFSLLTNCTPVLEVWNDFTGRVFLQIELAQLLNSHNSISMKWNALSGLSCPC